jgi:hypothetical protein
VRLEIFMNMENAAFEDAPSVEAARILRELADRLDGGRRRDYSSPHPHFSPGHDQALHDINGNEVGFAVVKASPTTSHNRGKVKP